MPAETLGRTSPPAVAAAAGDKPRAVTESRKSSKPIMEKRRRARINESLAQLKTLILDALKKDSSRHSKLEKADILEMTVKHLRNLQRLHITAAVSGEPLVAKYRSGFTECVGEVARFLSTCEGVNTEVRTRLLSHLAACVTMQVNGLGYYGAQSSTPPPPPQASPLAVQISCKSSSSSSFSSSEEMKLFGGFQVVPTPDGHFAVLVPSVALRPVGSQSAHQGSLVGAAPPSDSVWRPW